MRFIWLLLSCLFITACAPAGGRDASGPSAQAFAVVSPGRAAGLGSNGGGSAEAKSVVKAADAALARQPRPVRFLRVDGLLPGQDIHDQSVQAARDFPAMMNLALAWRLTGDGAYLDGADRYLSAWLEAFHPRFRAMDETGLDMLLVACDLVRDDLPGKTRRDVAVFARRLAEGYLDAPPAGQDAQGGLWRAHRVKLAALASFASGDAIQIERARKAFKDHLEDTLRQDGSTADFEEHDSLRATTMGLEPLVLSALAAREHGQDWYGLRTTSGASLAGSLAWLRVYTEGGKIHREFDGSKVAFDFVRRDAGVPGFVGQWNPREAKRLYQMAARLDRSFAHAALLLGRAKSWLALCFPEAG